MLGRIRCGDPLPPNSIGLGWDGDGERSQNSGKSLGAVGVWRGRRVRVSTHSELATGCGRERRTEPQGSVRAQGQSSLPTRLGLCIFILFLCMFFFFSSSESQCRGEWGCGNSPPRVGAEVSRDRTPKPRRFEVEQEGLGGAAQKQRLAPPVSLGRGADEALAGRLAEGTAEPSLNGTEGFRLDAKTSEGGSHERRQSQG